ncbi:hypothetical protein K469DRAFT_750962 [Zopfia rhizophila CBS 207.26]|uniref:Uncharacterized protein n=1 Tax=Zopfia rhizophila CBS 207.26 TaxID=1314779 RepID=A0A6A6E102_9PEZI|nr:hypothetical protein K469DRAFT_750962 [Zopfia rhizophila CBS 207.26]
MNADFNDTVFNEEVGGDSNNELWLLWQSPRMFHSIKRIFPEFPRLKRHKDLPPTLKSLELDNCENRINPRESKELLHMKQQYPSLREAYIQTYEVTIDGIIESATHFGGIVKSPWIGESRSIVFPDLDYDPCIGCRDHAEIITSPSTSHILLNSESLFPGILKWLYRHCFSRKRPACGCSRRLLEVPSFVVSCLFCGTGWDFHERSK